MKKIAYVLWFLTTFPLAAMEQGPPPASAAHANPTGILDLATDHETCTGVNLALGCACVATAGIACGAPCCCAISAGTQAVLTQLGFVTSGYALGRCLYAISTTQPSSPENDIPTLRKAISLVCCFLTHDEKKNKEEVNSPGQYLTMERNDDSNQGL